MNISRSFLITFLILASGALTLRPLWGEGQLDSKLEWVADSDNSERVWMIQKTVDGKLILTPNESFFPNLGLKANGQGATPDIAGLNKKSSFAEIGGWDNEDIAEWGLLFPRPGTIRVKATLIGNAKFSINVGTQSKPITSGRPVSFQIFTQGQHSLKLICERAGQSAAFQQIEISGEGAKGAAVIRKRWRPAAAHTKFSSSKASGNVRLWIMEMDAVPNALGFYCPITTPFGYYGPSWLADGRVNKSFNFSLWSYGRGEPEPPIEQLSHLIGIGNPTASFNGFGHEGTGVKIRDWEPLAGRQEQRQAIALRFESGEVYDTYFSYFYAADEKRWRFFGAGKKFHKNKPLQSLWVGSFVEVPGPAAVQRTGHVERRMRYRGWVIDDKNRLSPLDQMQNGNIDRETNLTHTDRGVTQDGWFYLQTGGWTFRRPPNKGRDIRLTPSRKKPQVDFLDPADLEFLQTIPCEIIAEKLTRSNSGAELQFRIRNAGKDPQVTVYWGSKEGLTFADRWEHNAQMKTVEAVNNQFSIEGLKTKRPLYVRLLLKNSEGQFWSSETLTSNP
ncbi:MAG: DUF3472 domain-containing protein, partial [Planctomycetaceae bacterium]|jgi:hypothetical protein|nr:DUF3472 domain-containing protein [Planctomycetaceae bacterium]